jgi:hypothetical protein
MATQPLTLNLGEGSITFSFSPEAGRELQQAIAALTEHLKVNAAQAMSGQPAGKPTPQPSTDFCHKGAVRLEIFCNPNIWPSPYAAKVLITLKDENIRLTTEAELNRVTEDLSQYLEQYS